MARERKVLENALEDNQYFVLFNFLYYLCELTDIHGLQSKGEEKVGESCGLSAHRVSSETGQEGSRKKVKFLAKVCFWHSDLRPALIVSMDLFRGVRP